MSSLGVDWDYNYEGTDPEISPYPADSKPVRKCNERVKQFIYSFEKVVNALISPCSTAIDDSRYLDAIDQILHEFAVCVLICG